MHYNKTVVLKDGSLCLLKNADGKDAAKVCAVFTATHAQTDYLLTYPDENTLDVEREREYLTAKTASENEVELCAILDGKVVGTAGISAVSSQQKLRHRAEFGIGIDKAYWGNGIGRALTDACIECARTAGYAQLELDVVADNAAAIALYHRAGFVEYGRNPRGFRSRLSGWQELVLMRLVLD